MKSLFKLALLCTAFLFQPLSYAQNPTYTLDVNDATPQPCNFIEFDIDMTWTNSGVAPNFEYAGGQYFFDVNPAIGGGGTITMSNVGSDLPSNMQPRNPTVFTGATPWQLRWAVNTFPGAGSGFQMLANVPVKIVRVRLQTTAPQFAQSPLNLVWRNALPNPFTKIFAYVGTTNTDISTPATHMISISNNPLGACAPFLTANFYSSQRVINQGQSVNFFDSTTSYPYPPTIWSWTFSGGTPSTSDQRNPSNITYYTPGTYDVSLYASNGPYSNSITKTGYITVLPGCITTWDHKIRIRDAGITVDSLRYGMGLGATNGLDTCLGEVAVPPPPPLGVFDCRFVLPNNDAAKTDIRLDGNFDVSWQMTFQPSLSGYPFTFTWDPAALPPYGTFYLKDEITGTLVNVNMRNQSSYVLTLSGISSLKIEYYFSRTLTAAVVSGWNILSVPVRAQNMNYATLFPGVASQAFTYNNGYVPVTTLTNGAGYWMKFNSAGNYNITGYSFQPENMNVISGWNLIGPFDKNIPVSSIVSIPSGIVNSYYFGYSGRYLVADTLKSGKGYWVRTTSPGYLYKGTMDNNPNNIASNPLDGFAKLNFVAADNNEADLYVGASSDITSDYSMPPVPPLGIFDVRFGTDKFVEAIEGNQTVRISSSSGETKLKLTNAGGLKFRIRDGIDGTLLNKELSEGVEITIPANLSSLLLETLNLIPLTYELSQNYPNPFNPVTTIKYQIPKEGKVKIALYDVLGKEVKSIVNDVMPAGVYEVKVDAGDLASGVYFYRMSSGSFEELKKMIVLK